MIEDKVKTAIEEIRPSLQADGGDIEYVSVSPEGTVTVKLTGACHGCPMAAITLKQGVEEYLKRTVPEVTEVVSA